MPNPAERDQKRVRLRRALPQTRSFDPVAFEGRHRPILLILAAHSVGIAVFGIARDLSVLHSIGEGAVVGALALIAAQPLSPRTRSIVAATGLITSSALLVHLSGGTIEAHFHFFVVLGLMTLYHDWTTYLVALAYVVIHHGVLGVLDPTAVYNHPAAQANPWGWALIHGGFVLSMTVAQVFSWRVSDKEHERAEAFRSQAQAAALRRRQALNLNDDVVQGLVIAKISLAVGDRARSEAALDAALANARSIIGDLIGESTDGQVLPGSLVRGARSGRLEATA